MKKNLVILGASGSIGQNTVSLLDEFNDKYSLIGVSVGNNSNYLKNLLKSYNTIKYAYLISDDLKKEFIKEFPLVKFYSSIDGLNNLLIDSKGETDVILNALIGYVGLAPSILTLKLNKILLLANKESLVIGGEIINNILKDKKEELLYPIDSEHASLKKLLHNVNKEEIEEVIITCSGGPFFNYKEEEFYDITFKDSLNHPTYKMGNKITIDSSTLMNKAFEIIEAHYLFDLPSNKIKVLINRESYVHALVKLKDGTIKLSVSKPDMKLQIRDALNLFKLNENEKEFKDTEINTFNNYKFYEVDKNKFPLINYGHFVIKNKNSSGLLLSDIDEVIFNYFKENKIKYIDIKPIIDILFKRYDYSKKLNEENIAIEHELINCLAIETIEDYIEEKGK